MGQECRPAVGFTRTQSDFPSEDIMAKRTSQEPSHPSPRPIWNCLSPRHSPPLPVQERGRRPHNFCVRGRPQTPARGLASVAVRRRWKVCRQLWTIFAVCVSSSPFGGVRTRSSGVQTAFDGVGRISILATSFPLTPTLSLGEREPRSVAP